MVQSDLPANRQPVAIFVFRSANASCCKRLLSKKIKLITMPKSEKSSKKRKEASSESDSGPDDVRNFYRLYCLACILKCGLLF